jgi:hypothetical protein
VLVRLVVLVLAVLMMTGSAAQAYASPDDTGIVDDAPTLDPPILPVQVTAPLPELPARIQLCAPPSPASGRRHAVVVFRPPRRFASR